MAVECPKCHSENPETKQFCGDCGTSLTSSSEPSFSQTRTLETPAHQLSRGTIFAGRYEIIEELGVGGMGKVYRVEDTKAKEEIALKLIRSEIASDKKTIERFRKELTTARKIAHRNVCRMHDLGEDDGAYFITMEYVPGEDLKSFMTRSKRLSITSALSIARQICEGLAEAHSLGIVHRDLKPSNIMIDRQGNVRIMDFGIARSLKEKGITGAGMIVGTPEYMSPEQAEAKETDHRSDLYSLGVLLYEMVTGTLPFTGDTALSVALKHKSEIPEAPRIVNPQIPGELNDLILRCLEKDRKSRYQDAKQILSDLENIDKGLPLTPSEARPGKALTSREITVSLSVRKLLVPALSVVVLVAAIAVLLKFLPKKNPVYAPKIDNSVAVISFRNQTGDAAYDHLQEMIPNLLITKLENAGRYYVLTWERMRDLQKQTGRENSDFVDSDTGFKICRLEGIEAIVIGSYSKAGNVFALNVNVLEVDTKESIRSASSTGEGEASLLSSQIDTLGREISLGMGGGPGSKNEPASADIAEITTDSLAAYRSFLDGKEAFEKGYLETARQHLEKAVAADPDFVSPYLHLVWLYGLQDDLENIQKALDKAKSLSDRATEKEKLYIEAESANFIEEDAEKYQGLLRQIARRYPREKIVYHYLGDFYWDSGRLHDAIGEYLKGLELDPEYGLLLYHTALCYLLLEDTDKAVPYLERHEAAAPDDAVVPYLWGGLHLLQGRVDEALASFNKALQLKPDYLWPMHYVLFIAGVKEDYAEFIQAADRLYGAYSSPASQSWRHLWKAFIHLWLGDTKRSLQSLNDTERTLGTSDAGDQRLVIAWLKFALFYFKGEYDLCRGQLESFRNLSLKKAQTEKTWHHLHYLSGLGLVALREGRLDEAGSKAAEAQATTPAKWWRYVHTGRLLQQEIWLSKGNLSRALDIDYELVPRPFAHGALFYDCMFFSPFLADGTARAYEGLSDLDKAIESYEYLIAVDPEKNSGWLIHPLFHYRLARLYERKGRRDRAVERYEKFLDLWRNADPGLPEVEDAKKRLAGLTGS